ncbi:stringent starvation protein B [Marinibactrum halimedae]|uniref:Stringent starvation protein B n=2 Tax=Marinibactrum halimedae TaxID=1444977 RepID=A0AA37T2R1_9GAMM|nr:stringent starvation protein B [Marinibactrum halimedae]
MTSSKPYMIKALYDWIVDNHCTPYLLVDSLCDGVLVPQQYVNKDGQIVLNISPSAVMGLDMSLESIGFNARFGGVPMDIYVPCYAVVGIYAKENGQGMMFEVETPPEPPKPKKSVKPVKDSTPTVSPKSAESSKPSLRVVK